MSRKLTEQEELDYVRSIGQLFRGLGRERSPAWIRREVKLLSRRRDCTVAEAYAAMETRLLTDGDWAGDALADAA